MASAHISFLQMLNINLKDLFAVITSLESAFGKTSFLNDAADSSGLIAAPINAIVNNVSSAKQVYSIKLVRAEAKIPAIRAVKDASGLGLRESKQLLESLPAVLDLSLDFEKASLVAQKLAEADVQAEVVPAP